MISFSRNPYSLQLSFLAQGDLFLWYIILTLLALLFLIFVIFSKALMKGRSKKTKSLAIDLKTLEKMRQTGLISSEEQEQARRAISKYLLQTLDKEKEEKSPLTPLHPREITAPKAERRPIYSVGEREENRIGGGGIREKNSKLKEQRPINVEDLYRKGIITEEEYIKLQDFFAKKPKSQE